MTGPDAARHPLHLLLAEDDPVSRQVGRMLLTRLGHRVDVVADGLEAVAAVQQGSYDAVLMDVQMPGLDGLAATRRIRAGAPDRARVPVVAVSAGSRVEDQEACAAAGMDAATTRPSVRVRRRPPSTAGDGTTSCARLGARRPPEAPVLVTWTVLRTGAPVPTAPWAPTAATWWQAGRSSPGRAQAPEPDGRWWSVVATWADRAAAGAPPSPSEDAELWHVVLEAFSTHGDVVMTDGSRPFDDLVHVPPPAGPVILLTVAGSSADDGREREFFRRFVHASRDVGRAPGHLVSLVHAPVGAPEAGPVLTFSAWQDLGAGLDWAYTTSRPHAATVTRQRGHRLVETSGSVRCRVVSSRGVLGEAGDPLASMGPSGVADHHPGSRSGAATT